MTTYKLEIRDPKGLTVKDWPSTSRPNEASLSRYLTEYSQFLAKARGYKPLILNAKIVTAKRGKVVAEYHGNTVSSES